MLFLVRLRTATRLLSAVLLVSTSVSGCSDRQAELDKHYGLDVPGNPYLDYGGDIREVIISLRQGYPEDAYEMFSGYKASDFPGAEDLFTEVQTKIEWLGTGRRPEGAEGQKPNAKEVVGLLRQLIEVVEAHQSEMAAERAGDETE